MVPASLRTWFVVHCVADLLAAIPLFVAPRPTLLLLGWTCVDPMATRIVAAALFGIGIESYLGRNGDLAAFRGMLRLKVIWSSAALAGSLWTQLDAGPGAGWVVTGTFLVFHAIWLKYALELGALRSAPTSSPEAAR